ncbi:hypothetical protein EJ07DRAFT_158541 [Lizonia empirigonia]|nr:hypothetical protein EJ07DRAFT_158541 [Lizonia empirigonia]
MASPRLSTSTGQSNDTTAIDPHSTRPSPKLGDEFEGQRDSSAGGTCLSRSATVSSVSSLAESISTPYEPKDRSGWPRLAEIMADVPEFAAFPRYRDLNIKTLLYYKVQLDVLQEKIMKKEEEQTLEPERYDMIAQGHSPDYHVLLLEARDLLEGYNKALVQYSQVSALPDPEDHNMRSLRKWLDTDDGARVRSRHGFDTTWGKTMPEQSVWTHARAVLAALLLAKSPPKSGLDLVVTHPEAKVDGLTKWVVYYLMPLYWKLRDDRRKKREPKPPSVFALQTLAARQQDPEAPENAQSPKRVKMRRDFKSLEKVSEATALRFTSALSTVIACLIPVVAIAVLTQVSGTRDLLLCITGFAVIFAVGLIFLTQGTSSRTEIFAATAAFSAVMVVFISQPIIQMPPGSEPPVISM